MMDSIYVAVATAAKIPNGNNDTAELMRALRDRELTVDLVIWDDPSIYWGNYDFVFLHAVWDYSDKIADFRNWLASIRPKVSFVNPIDLIMWNMDKRYLLDLQKKGITIPRTIAFDSANQVNWADVRSHFHEEQQFVVKSAISAGGRGTWLCSNLDLVKEQIVTQKLEHKPILFQAYESSIETNGEYSAICFDGVLSHMVQKTPKKGEFKVQPQYGGSIKMVSGEQWTTFVEQVLHALPVPAKYARIDFLVDQTGEPKLIEVELIEPDLFLRYHPESYKQLVNLLVP